MISTGLQVTMLSTAGMTRAASAWTMLDEMNHWKFPMDCAMRATLM